MKLSSYKHLVKEWHPTKNGYLTPNDFTYGSRTKVWWLCSKGHSHESVISSRTRKKPTGCPFCSGRKVSEENNLQKLFPEIAKEWHPTKNGDLTPNDFTHATRKKVWWQCSEGHSFETEVRNRTRRKMVCPHCPKNYASATNNLLLLFPEIAKEWHPTKNGKLTPSDVAPNTQNIAWWLCPKGHTYDAKVNNRTRYKKKSKCPYCLGRRVGEDNNLLVLFPEVAKEWHPTKNGELTPEQFVPGSKTKVWWLCPKNHSYKTAIQRKTQKNNPTGCPHCSNQSSVPEIRILSELKWFFDEVKHRYKLDGLEIDVFLPNFNIGIEYDGKHWHKDLVDIDLEKNQFLLSHDIHLVRVRQHPLKPLTENDVIVGHSFVKKDIDEILKRIVPFVDNNIKEKINTYLAQSSFVNDDLFKKYRSYFPSPFPENSLLETHPELSEEWDYKKNYPLRPENFSYGSHHKAWWLCPIGHSNKSVIQSRTEKRARGCPFCSGRKKLSRLTAE